MEVFANTLLSSISRGTEKTVEDDRRGKGIARWLFELLRARSHTQPKLAILGRVSLAPRQFLTLVESEGQRLLVASSPNGAPAFYALKSRSAPQSRSRSRRAPERECAPEC